MADEAGVFSLCPAEMLVYFWMLVHILQGSFRKGGCLCGTADRKQMVSIVGMVNARTHLSLLCLVTRPLFLDVYRFLKAVLAPFLVAMIISYVLNPVVCMLSDRKVPRSMAVSLIYAVFLTSLAVILMNMIPMLIRQLEELNEHLPELTMNAQSLMTNLDSRSAASGSKDRRQQLVLADGIEAGRRDLGFHGQYRQHD